MIQLFNAANIFSKLASNSSLLPIAVKDGAHSVGMTTASYITGKEVEGKDRFIDEFGTQAIWLGGIPAYKKLIDLTIYKIAGRDSKVDVRLLDDKNAGILKKAIEHAPEGLKEKIEKAASKKGLFQGLAIGKFIAATALTLGSYWALTNFRHKHTEKNIIKQIKQEEAAKKAKLQAAKKENSNPAFKQHNPSFGMNLNAVKDFMFNPVKNMMIVDGGITAERLSESRNPQDFMGYVIKEGAFWGFMYFAGAKIQEHFEKVAAKKGKPIDLDIKVLQDKEFEAALGNGGLDKALKDFVTDSKTDEEIYEMLFKPMATDVKTGTINDNLVVKMAKRSGLIQVVAETDASGKEIPHNLQQIDTRYHIEIGGSKKVEGIRTIRKKMATLLEESAKHGKEDLKNYLDKVVDLKRWSIAKNIGACVLALGVVVPGTMLLMRYMDKDNKEFAVKKQLHEKLKQNNLV